MPEKLMKWEFALLFAVVGLLFIVSPNTISVLPTFIHYIIGAFLLIGAGYLAYKELK